MNPIMGAVVAVFKAVTMAVVAVVSFVVSPFGGAPQPSLVPLNQADMPPAVEAVTISDVQYGPAREPVTVGSAGQMLYVHGTAQDMNGCQTINSVTLEFYPTAAGSCSSSASCVAVSSPMLDQCSVGSNRVRYQFSLSVSPPNPSPQGWTAHVVAADNTSVGANNDETTLQTSAGVVVPSSSTVPVSSSPVMPLFVTATPVPSKSVVATATPVPTSTSTTTSSDSGPSYLTLPAPTTTP